MKFETVIFDLDGTLLNTLDDLCDSANYVMKMFNRRSRSIEEVRNFVGNGLKELMRKCLDKDIADEETERCLAEFKKHYAMNLNNKTAPYKGIKELIVKLSSMNIKTGIVSNKADAALKSLCEIYFPQIGFAAGEREGIKRKPAPDGVLYAIDKLGGNVNNAVYVGDSEVDIQTARNARLPVISVTWGFREAELLKSLHPDYIVDNVDSLCILLTGEKL